MVGATGEAGRAGLPAAGGLSLEALRALAALCEPPSPESRALADLLELGEVADEAAWSDLFLFQLYPYASVYLGPEGGIGGEARDRIAGFWRALELVPPAECDHLAVLLAFQAELGERQEKARDEDERRRWRHVRRAFLWEHLLSWLPAYLTKLERLAPPFYRGWGKLLGEILGREAERLPRPSQAPIHWRQAPALADPRRDGSGAFLASLLAPAVSGLIVGRGDLRRASRDLGLALRIGERRFVLESLLGQEPRAVLAWLEKEAERWRAELAAPRADGLSAGSSWLERCRQTADLLAELRRAKDE